MTSEQKSLFQIILTSVAIGAVGFFVMTWLLSPVFSGAVTLPQHITIAGLRFQFYGALLAIGAFAGYWLALRRREKFGIDPQDVDSIILLCVVFGFIGARLYHVISEYTLYVSHPAQIFAVWNGGLSIYGAGIAGVIVLFVYNWYYKKYAFAQLLDWLTPSIVIGQIIGRFGNFLNYELYGLPTNLPWRMYVPPQFRLPPFELNQFFHPLFLYEAAGSTVILVLLLRLKLKPGYLFLLWLFLYNVMRFLLEQIRIGSVIYGNIRVNGIVSLILAATAIAVWYKLKTIYKSTENHVQPNSLNS